MSAERRDRSRAAQLKLMLRQQEDLDVVLLLVAWYVWRERVAWLQTSLWWKRTSGRDCFLQEALQHWRSAVPLKRQEAIDEQLMSLRGSMVQDAKAMDRVAEKVEEHGTKVLHQLQAALQKKDAQTSRRKVFHAWQQCAASRHQNFGHVQRASVAARLCAICATVTRPHLLRMGRRAFGAWREALENREQRGAARLFLKFKLLHQGSWQKEQLHVMLLRWFSLVQRPRLGAERPWQRAWQLLAAQQILVTDQRLLHAWRAVKTSACGSEKLKTLQKRYKANENERRKVQGCRQLYDLLVKADVSCHLLAHCMNAWKETRLRRAVDEGMEVSLQSVLTAASSSLSSEMRALSDRIQSSQRSERRHQVASGLRRLEDFWAEWLKRRQLLSGALDGWRQCNAGVSLEKTTLRAEQQQERLSELEGQVEPMRNLLRESRRFLSSYLCGRCGRWRRELLREVLRLWHISIRFVRDAMRDKVLQLRRRLEIVGDGRGAGFAGMLGALALKSDRSEQIKHFLLEAWLRVAEQEKHQREVEVLARHLHTDSTRSCKKVSSILLEWMQALGSNGAWLLRDVLRGWATVVSSSMQKKIQHFRKLQAHAEITKLCVSTGDWIDQLWLREVLALWHRQALQEILTRHAAEEERSRTLQVRLKAHYRIIELIRGKSTERQTALALAHVCLGAWSMSAAMENARKLTDKARQNSLGHRSHGRRMLSDAQDLAGAVLAFCFRQSLSGLQKSAAWPLVKRCFPLWRREAALSSARRHILAQEAANLQITEEMRLQTERYQQRCSRWAVAQMIQHQKMRYLEEAFFLWCNQKPQWRHRLSHQKHLELADVVLMKGAQQQQVFFVAWKRVQAEEKVMRSEEEMWQLEARLARLAGERGLSMRALEERLSLEGTDFRGVPWRH